MAGAPESLYVWLENREMVTSANIYFGGRVCKRKELAGEREYRTLNKKRRKTLLDRIPTDEATYRERKNAKFSLFLRIWQYCRAAERLVSLNAVNKTVFPVSPCWLHHPPLSRGFFFFSRSQHKPDKLALLGCEIQGPIELQRPKSLENSRSIR